MAETPPKTLELALDALISIEKGIYPTDECLNSLTVTVYAWLDDGACKSDAAKSLFKQATAHKKQINNKAKGFLLASRIVKKMDETGKSKSASIEDIAGKSSDGLYVPSERNIYENIKNSADSDDEIRRKNKLFEHVKKQLKDNPI